MSDFKRDFLAAAARDAIEGEIEVQCWKFIWGSARSWARADVHFLWARRSSSRALLTKVRDFYVEVITREEGGITTWQCTYETDRHGSYCRYELRTRQPREFYAMAVAARSERSAIGVVAARARPATSMRL